MKWFVGLSVWYGGFLLLTYGTTGHWILNVDFSSWLIIFVGLSVMGLGDYVMKDAE